MKLIFTLVYIFLYVVPAHSMTAKEAINLIQTSELANRLSSSKNLNDFSEKVRLDSSDQKLFAADLKKAKALKDLIPKFEVKNTQVVFSDVKVTLDFKSFSEGTLYFNEHKINIKNKIPYIRAKVMVEDMMKTRSALLDLILPHAQADIREFLSSFFAVSVSEATLVSEALYAADMKLDGATGIAEAIVKTYKNESTMWTDYRKRLGSDTIHLTTFVFTCRGTELASVESIWADRNNTTSREKLTYANEKILYKDRDDSKSKCEAEFDKDGRILRTIRGCVSKQKLYGDGASFYGFFNFPKVAEACCKEEGCYERTSSALNAIIRQSHGIKKTYPSSSSSGNN